MDNYKGGTTMSLVRWDPFRNVSALQDRINRLFDESIARSRELDDDLAVCAWRPTVDIFETPEGVKIRADLPGVGKENIEVEVKDNVLTLKGQRPEDQEIEEDRYLRKERCCGSFHRAFALHSVIQPDTIKAKFKDGVLEVFIPKPENEKPLRVKVDID
jgi:HSP20 family protein